MNERIDESRPDDLQKTLIAQAEAKDGRPYNQDNVNFVMSCLHYNGANRQRVSDQHFVEAYLLCNGFGDIDASFARDVGFDWSHVRDSTPIGFDRAAAYLRTVVG